jgi:hypothetical protein
MNSTDIDDINFPSFTFNFKGYFNGILKFELLDDFNFETFIRFHEQQKL